MAKILIEKVWYEEVAPTGLYESTYEAIIKAHADQLWPRFHPVHFKANVYSGAAGVRADLVLIEHDYSEWWVVEVEMAHHSFESHVLPQTRKLADASYRDEEAEKLCAASSKLDLLQVKAMLRDVLPRVLVVVNKPKPEWAARLAEFNALLAVFEIFKADDGSQIFRVNGDHPVGTHEIISLCRIDELINRWLSVESPISLRLPNQGKLSIEFNGHTAIWERFETNGRVWLHTPEGPNPLPDRYDYQLVRRGDGRFAFESVPKKVNK